MHKVFQLSELAGILNAAGSSSGMTYPPAEEIESVALEGPLNVLGDLQEAFRDLPTHAFCPIFFRILDPAGIPVLRAMDNHDTANIRDSLARVLFALRSFGRQVISTDFPSAALPELWDRVWHWVAFFHAFRAQLPGPSRINGQLKPVSICVDIVASFWYTDHSSVVRQTPRIWVWAGAAWRVLLDEMDDVGCSHLCDIMASIPRSRAQPEHRSISKHIPELIQGAGGKPSDLAALIVRQYDRVLPLLREDGRSESALSIVYGCNILTYNTLSRSLVASFENGELAGKATVIARLLHKKRRSDAEESDADPAFALVQQTSAWAVLQMFHFPRYHVCLAQALRKGLFFVLLYHARSKDPELRKAITNGELAGKATVIARLLHKKRRSDAEESDADPAFALVQQTSAWAVLQMFHFPRYHVCLAQALRKGLFFVLLYHARSKDPELRKAITAVLRTTLPESTIIHSVLTELSAAFEAFSRMDAAKYYSEEDLKLWEEFVVLAKERLALYATFQRRHGEVLRACDNVLCDELCRKSELKCCAICRHAVYCSGGCQKQDWDAGHREACEAARIYRTVDAARFSRLDRSFFRFFMNNEYAKHSLLIAQTRLFWRARCPTQMQSIMFKPHPTAIERTRPQMRMFLLHEGPEKKLFEAQLARVARSGGRFEMHILRMQGQGGGQSGSDRIMPMRREKGTEYEAGLGEIAKGVRGDEVEIAWYPTVEEMAMVRHTGKLSRLLSRTGREVH
ncbi:MYND-type domain-containing protein [Mycena kentingensis (nom. inval.)]|nr:MYND-type domain-containing protein [Mycena kentingensis (nom. inval.)]